MAWRSCPRPVSDVLLVEGESDTQTLLYHAIPALGVPWRAELAQGVGRSRRR